MILVKLAGLLLVVASAGQSGFIEDQFASLLQDKRSRDQDDFDDTELTDSDELPFHPYKTEQRDTSLAFTESDELGGYREETIEVDADEAPIKKAKLEEDMSVESDEHDGDSGPGSGSIDTDKKPIQNQDGGSTEGDGMADDEFDRQDTGDSNTEILPENYEVTNLDQGADRHPTEEHNQYEQTVDPTKDAPAASLQSSHRDDVDEESEFVEFAKTLYVDESVLQNDEGTYLLTSPELSNASSDLTSNILTVIVIFSVFVVLVILYVMLIRRPINPKSAGRELRTFSSRTASRV